MHLHQREEINAFPSKRFTTEPSTRINSAGKKNLLLLECIHTVPWDWNRRVISYRNSIKLHLRLFVVKSLQLHLFLWHSFSVLECCKFLKTKCLRVNETTNYANTITINLIWCWANFSVRLMAQIKQSDYLLNSAEPFLVAEIVC